DDERHRQMEKERQIEFDKQQLAKNQQQFQPQQSQMEKDPEPIAQYTSQTFFTTHTTTLSITLIRRDTNFIKAVSPGDPQSYKLREPEPKQQKLQQYAGLMEVFERFHKIMKPIVEEEKMKPDTMLPGQYKHYLNKDDPMFFYPPKNYHPTPIPRPKDQDLPDEQGSHIPGLLNISDGVAGFININPQIYQSIPEAVIGFITFAAQQIEESETESEDQEQLTNKIERIVADGTNDNQDNDQSEHAIEPKHFTNGNDGLRENDSGTQLQATVNGEANPEINFTKTSSNTPPHNVNE
ncbi:MAG: hypothetical protein EZS28_049866, partial [Streblomastix strix]